MTQKRIDPPYALLAEPPRNGLVRLYCSIEEYCGIVAAFRLIHPYEHGKRWDACQDHYLEATYRARRGRWPERPPNES